MTTLKTMISNPMTNFIYKVRSLFSKDSAAKYLQAKVSHLVLDYGIARVKIAKARKVFESTVESTKATFENKKRSTLSLTVEAVKELVADAKDEQNEIDTNYRIANEKVKAKVDLSNTLLDLAERIGKDDFPLA